MVSWAQGCQARHEFERLFGLVKIAYKKIYRALKSFWYGNFNNWEFATKSIFVGFETVGTQYLPLSKSQKIRDNSWAEVPLPQDVKCNCITVT